jgi:beta-lactamase class A
MIKTIIFTGFLFFLCNSSVMAQKEDLRKEILKIANSKRADLGIYISGIEDQDTISFNGEKHYPMQSVFKFHIAIVVLNEVDQGRLFLDQKIHVGKEDLIQNTWSPIREEYPHGTTLTLAEILKYTVSQSDNIGCDLLLDLLGGTKTVNDYFQEKGYKDISILATEAEMHKDWPTQFLNWITPHESNKILNAFYGEELLSKQSTGFLWKIMTKTATGKKRIKGQLPEGTVVGHKTGSSGTNEKGITAAVNNIGIVSLPNGKHFSISVFVSNSTEKLETNEKIIADISKLAWDYFLNKKD